ncbi:MoaD/ThiS family protein [Nocardia donostiensis]|uniref:Molybdopterin synthase sulfur carrier subunit n=1 Tax=Nocardia donostiensis TaxID=1538463 RepID=A0A1W0AWZ3_9NOCA|nr:MoaD/ThiS family protein [Nocardia donostiensis]ONM49222.1 molybdopterin synthase sulfur carrier subunit [Nocardia donostiensis]OQS14745.1 molybdopterin synthase sulfur carrier subunit [Nocardia donostiensis]OQS17900.1 molybdopterin synthase sulfur carrier subunit [Nocardia donostiensis]
MVEIRYFAAIADAVGKDAEALDLPPGATVADLRTTLAGAYGPDLDKMLTVCAYLIGDELTRDPSSLLGRRVDVLPPFAGG